MTKQDDFDPVVLMTVVAGTQNANPIPQVPSGWRLANVWTIINENRLREHGLVHKFSAFLEDAMHDYKIRNGCLHYFSRLNSPGERVLVALEFESVPAPRKGARRSMP